MGNSKFSLQSRKKPLPNLHHNRSRNDITSLPTWSLKILEITTGTLCSAPPWKWWECGLTAAGEIWCQKTVEKMLYSLHNQCDLLTLMLKPRPPFACLLSTTVLCFRRLEFLIGKKILRTLKKYSGRYAAWDKMQDLSPLAHLHLLELQFHLCKPRPVSGWLIPLWSISGRHRRYCWSPRCRAEQSQIWSVGRKKSIDILPCEAITNTMNILILFPSVSFASPLLLV